jgi:hypothetical protein
MGFRPWVIYKGNNKVYNKKEEIIGNGGMRWQKKFLL